MKLHFHLLLAGLALFTGAPLSAQPAGDSFSWVDPVLPKPDAEGWITLFDGSKLYGTSLDAVRKKEGRIGVSNGYLWLENAGVGFVIKARNVALRAELKKISGQNVMLYCRASDGKKYGAWFNGGGDFGIGLLRPGWENLTASKSSETFADFFLMEVVAENSQIKLNAEGKMVAATNDSSIDQAGRVSVDASTGRSLFKKIQVKILDVPIPGPETKAEPASWTSTDGKVIQADFLKLNGQAVVILRNNKEYTIPFSKLAPASIAQAKKLAATLSAPSRN